MRNRRRWMLDNHLLYLKSDAGLEILLNITTPPRPSEISEKNVSTSHLWYKACWKYEENPGSPLGSTS